MENIAMDKTAENLARGSEMLESLSVVKADIAEQWAKTAEAQNTLAANVARMREFIDKSDKIVADATQAMEAQRKACEESAEFLAGKQAEMSEEYGRLMDTLNETMGGAVGTLFLSGEELAEQEAARAAEEAAARVVTREEALAALGLTEEGLEALVAAGEREAAGEGQDEAGAEGLDVDQDADGVDAAQGEAGEPEASPDEDADAQGEAAAAAPATDEDAAASVQEFLASKGLSMDDLLSLASKGVAPVAEHEAEQPAAAPEQEAADETLVIEPIHVEPVAAPAAESVDMSALDAMISSPAEEIDEPDDIIVVGSSPAPREATPAEPEGDGLSDEDRDLMDWAGMDLGRRDLRSMGLDPDQIERVIELRAQLTRG